MTKTVRIICVIIIAIMLLSCFAVGVCAADYREGNNDISVSYAGSVYYDRFRQVPITGDGPTDAIAVALSQIGYQEGDSEDHFDGMTSGNDNFTEYNYNFGSYGAGYGGSYYWCAAFVSFSLYQGQCHNLGKLKDWCRDHQGEEGYVWREISCQKWVEQLKKFRMFKSAPAYGGSYVPTYGDLIFFTSNQKTSSHIGIVLYTDDTKVYTIEGNTSSGSGLDSNGGGVYFKSYDLNSTYIFGYGTLPYERDEDVVKIDYSGANPTAGLYVSTTNKYIYLNADVDSYGSRNYDYLLPKYSMFEITEVVSNQLFKGVFTIDGKRVEGYIKNNSDRIIQLSDNANTDKSEANFKNSAIVNANGVYNLKNMRIDAYFVNDVAIDKGSIGVDDNASFGINGWMGFTCEIECFGYSVGGLDNMVFDESFEADTEDAIKLDANGGEFGRRFKITINSSAISDGESEVNFLVRLKDGRICIIDTVNVQKGGDITPPENSTEESTEAPTENTTEEESEQNTENTSEITTQTGTEAETEATTVENTATGEVITEEVSIAVGTDNGGKKKGCRSSLGAVSVIAITCVGLAFAKKKKED